MNLLLKQFLLISATFIIILWFQDYDDMKNNKVRKTFYEKYKLPLLVSSILGLILSFKELIIDSAPNCLETISIVTVRPELTNIPKAMSLSDMDQHVFTELPDF